MLAGCLTSASLRLSAWARWGFLTGCGLREVHLLPLLLGAPPGAGSANKGEGGASFTAWPLKSQSINSAVLC